MRGELEMKILLSSNKKIITDYIKHGTKIGFIATASELDDDRWYMEKDKNDLVNMNYHLIDIDITNETRENIISKFNSVDAVFIAGGNCFYLLQQLKSKEVLNDLIEFANKNIYIGSSAGSCITSPSIDYLTKLDDKTQAPLLNDYKAMNLINGYILPHYKSDEEYTRLIEEIIAENNTLNFITLTNEQAIIVTNNGDYKVVITE